MTATTSTRGSVNAVLSSAKDAHDERVTAPGAPALPLAHTTGVGEHLGEGAAPAPAAPVVVGIDLSLTATGVAHVVDQRHVTDVITVAGRDIVRLRRLVHEVKQFVRGADLVVLEGPAYAARHGQQGHHERAGLYWLLQDRLLVARKPVAVVPPTCLKLYALGKGGGKGTDKVAVTVAARDRLGYTGTENNEADALWLATMGHAWLTGEHPVPVSHRRALDSCEWPT